MARAILGILVGAGLLVTLTAVPVLPAAADDAVGGPYPDIDVRADERIPPTPVQRQAARTLGGATVRWGRFGTPQMVVPAGREALTGARAAASAEKVALDHVRAQAELYRFARPDLASLKVLKSYRSAHNGLRHVFIGQLDAGRPVYGSRLSVAVDRSGRVVAAGGPLAPGAHATTAARLGREDALGLAAGSVRSAAPPTGGIAAERVTFPLLSGARPAWRTGFTASDGHRYETVVDAGDGRILYRSDLTSAEGPAGLVHTGQSPQHGPASLVPFTGPGGSWVSGRVTTGNNAEASQDPDAEESLGHQPVTPPAGEPGHQRFEYRFTDAFRTSGGKDLSTDRDAVVTQAFYYANRMHDILCGLGFDEASGNFQHDNFGKGGEGSDRVEVYADYGANNPDDACNANFTTPDDGESPVMRLFVGRESCGDMSMHRAMNGDTVAHEYTHGMSKRLVGGGLMGEGIQTGALGEGWSDAMATSLWDDPVYGEYNSGDHRTGIRRVSYDNSPLTYRDLCREDCQVHQDGEIWASALWDLRTALIHTYGEGPGRQRQLRLLVDGMKLTPAWPDFLDARDALLAADKVAGGADRCLLWRVFARRGMGAGASSPVQSMPFPAYDLRADCR